MNGIRITSLFLMGLGGVQILRYMLNGAGDSMYALVNGIVEVIARVAFAIGLTAIPLIGMWGIWLTTGLTWTVTALFALVRYKHGAWMSKKLVRAVRVPLRQKEADTLYSAYPLPFLWPCGATYFSYSRMSLPICGLTVTRPMPKPRTAIRWNSQRRTTSGSIMSC